MPEQHARAYDELHLRVDGVLRAAEPAAFDRVAPATPQWTLHDVVAHMAGVVDDVVHGRLEGVATDAWTAKQVDARRGVPVAAMLDAWNEQAPQFQDMLTAAPAEITGQALFDAVTHEHDVRQALGEPGARDSDALAFAWAWAVDARTREGAPSIRYVTEAGAVAAGAGEPVATVRTSRFELVRASSGRRTAAEISAYEWDPEPRPDLLLFSDIFTFRTESLGE